MQIKQNIKTDRCFLTFLLLILADKCRHSDNIPHQVAISSLMVRSFRLRFFFFKEPKCVTVTIGILLRVSNKLTM